MTLLTAKDEVPGVVDGAIFHRGHEPPARILWHARFRPLFERRDQSVLRQAFGKS